MPTPVGPPAFRGACAVWSRHAAELAAALVPLLEHWEETPSTQGLVTDGLLERILPGAFLPPDLLCSAVDRAIALGCAVGTRLRPQHIIGGTSAAWVLLGGTPPAPAELMSTAHRGDIAGVTMRHARLLPAEVETIGGAPVTEPARTAADLLRFAPQRRALALVAGLIASGHVQESRIAQSLAGLDRYPGARTAEARLLRVRSILDGRRAVRTGCGPGQGTARDSGSAEPTGLPSAVTR